MKVDTKKQMGWFVRALFKLRKDPDKVDGFGASIVFDKSLLNPELFDLNTGVTAYDHVAKMLQEIKDDDDFLIKVGKNSDKLLWEDSGDEIIIKGFGTEFLLSYLKHRYTDGSFFGYAKNDKGQQVITVLGGKTDVLISGNQHVILAQMLKFSGEEYSWEQIVYGLMRTETCGQDYWNSKDAQGKMTVVNDNINNLRRTLHRAAKGYLTEDQDIIINKRGGIYKLIW